MTRTQIQLPDELYDRAKRFGSARELSLAEMTRRGLEMFLARFPEATRPRRKWQLPRANGGGIKVPLGRLHDVAAEEESGRSLRRK